jgi:alanyl-tRNA synthetase
MIIRRAARFGGKIGLKEPFLARAAEAVIETYGGFYPELQKNRQAILDNLTREEIRFARTIESGVAQLQNMLDAVRSGGGKALGGAEAFDLYATYGLPFEIARDIAREQNLDVDEPGFRAAMDEHRLASGGGKAMGSMGGEDAEFYAGVLNRLKKAGQLTEHGVEYDPYTSPRVEGEILALVANGTEVDSAGFGDSVEVVLPRTGFYIESGGQVSDEGVIRSSGGRGDPKAWEIEVTGMRRPSAGVIVHVGEVLSGQPRVGDRSIAEVDMPRRHDIMRNHTATHLLHAALHQVLGEHARQAGSLVAPDRLRFDFNHPEAMTQAQIQRVEQLVNDAVAADLEVIPRLKSREDAIAEGAMALFGEKYGETVRTITIASGSAETAGRLSPDDAALDAGPLLNPRSAEEDHHKYSYELCGGTHLERTSDVGLFLIVSEGSAAAGVRRIEAVTGRGAYALVSRRFAELRDAADLLKSSLEEVPARADSLLSELSETRRQLSDLRRQQALGALDAHLSEVRTVGECRVLAIEVPNADPEVLRTLGDRFRERYSGQAVAVFAAGQSVIAVVTDDLVRRGLKAADLINAIGGKGGGRPHMAQGSIGDEAQVKQALDKVAEAVASRLK